MRVVGSVTLFSLRHRAFLPQDAVLAVRVPVVAGRGLGRAMCALWVGLRGGWGYDDDSKPKAKYAAKWKQFVKELAAGRTPAWTSDVV